MTLSAFGLSGVAVAEEAKNDKEAKKVKKLKVEKSKPERQPWSEYWVHDMKCPPPVKVKTDGAVVVKAPADAIVIFDGKNTDALKQAWEVKDGVLIASPKKNPTTQSFGDIEMHVEWRIPAGREINGQRGGNSGIFLMGLYEIQIQESHTNVTYADGQAAALYGQTPPKVNASTPQGEWQSFHITFTAPVYGEKGMEKPAYATVVHNGVVVHDHQKFYGPTKHNTAATYPDKHPKKSPVTLQFHGDPVEFRNIWIREL